MWRGLAALLVFAGVCFGSPAGNDDDEGLLSLIDDYVRTSTVRSSQTENLPQQTPPGSVNNNKLDALITDVYGTPNTTLGTTSGTILGINNRPRQTNDCECVPYYLCRDGEIIESGIGLIDVRLSPCLDSLDVCCKPPNIVKEEDKVTPPTTRRVGCGKRNPDGLAVRITGHSNNEAQFAEFPWMVAILKEVKINDKNVNVYQCGGALIHQSAVLTAAHCVDGKAPSELTIRAGEWDTQTKNEIFPHQDRRIQKVIIHKDFDSGSLHNDFAILILSEPVEYAQNVDVVCLPDRNMAFDEGNGCFASGWGKDLFGKEGHYQVILKRVELPLVPRNRCQDLFRGTRLGKYFRLHESFICAGGEAGKDTCTGDGGSPLVCPLRNDPTRYVQAGIVAWGIGCGTNIPGAYANIAFARDWIDAQMIANNLDTTSYRYSA